MRVRSILFLLIAMIVWGLSCTSQPSQGEMLYQAYCGNCHMENGQGLRELIPPLAEADYWQNNQSKVACIIRNGIAGPIKVNGVVYDQPMAGIKTLTEAETANIINYINQQWYPDAALPFVNPMDVRAALESCK